MGSQSQTRLSMQQARVNVCDGKHCINVRYYSTTLLAVKPEKHLTLGSEVNNDNVFLLTCPVKDVETLSEYETGESLKDHVRRAGDHDCHHLAGETRRARGGG